MSEGGSISMSAKDGMTSHDATVHSPPQSAPVVFHGVWLGLGLAGPMVLRRSEARIANNQNPPVRRRDPDEVVR